MKVERCYRDFGLTVRAIRQAGEMSQARLGERVGLTRTSICNIEAGVQRVLLADVARFAKALRVDPRDILKGVWP